MEFQRFTAKHPVDGSDVPMANLIVHWQPQSKERIMLCAHYNTLPLPLKDPDPVKKKQGRFVGANDNASGVALLMELGRAMARRKSPCGVDFVLLDGKEYVFSEEHEFFLGSTHFAEAYAADPPPYRYRCGVLLDIVGTKELHIHREYYSMSWPDTQPLIASIWATAARLGVREFSPEGVYEVRDDHLPIHQIAKFPICDIIDFGYLPWYWHDTIQTPWHTEGDTPDKCSPLSLAKVGWVISEWLSSTP